ncbi:NAD(P)-dependent alcohol dehydrogenase [Xanthomonas campestris pv. badrii]|uniref:NAD(P)-dependent alcohol dehydrogenase n=1 Tax=Xanthomonas campestris pv. badrii TaxID=149696 RepID=A0A7Z2VB98_XANCA|nr:NAD(P)-dependent alcohol dehydrogenase [Xanthomonas campestris]MCC4605112.1 NAD(P)-dependent alcohol dehydrogenase [Xanthomonas campestris pv. parthenii]QJD68330.1 NAD(P)-dependent alcohol dehydrogenase [Xanthomonas campestris pv. badrii]
MRAIRLAHPGGLDALQSVELPDPGQPARGQIRVRLQASSLNYHDLGIVLGQMPTAHGRIPMSDGAGVIEAVGPEVSEFAVGDHVVSTFFPQWLDGEPVQPGFATTPGDGVDGYARSAVVAAATAFTHAPAGYSHAQAATLTTAGVTAWRALVVNGGLKAGDTVLVLGTGGVSIFALQFAKAMGARVIATSSSDEKLETARALGADHVVNYRQHAEWSAQVLEITDGRGVDHVVEVGGPGTLAQSIRAARVGGHIALIGVLTGAAGPVPTAEMMGRHQRLQGLVVGSRRHQRDLVRALDGLPLRPVIDRAYPLEAIGEAFALQKAGGHLGKIVLEF